MSPSFSFERSLSLLKTGLANYTKKRPLCISFEVTHCCNARCKHCHLGGIVEEERASPLRFGNICRELRPVTAQVSGGEPLLRKDVAEIVSALRTPNRSPFIALTTNGALLTKKKYEELLQAGLDEFSVSLDYPDERHDEFRGIPGLFRRIHDLIQEVNHQENKHITLCCVIQSDNFRYLSDIVNLASTWGVQLNFSAYTPLRTQDMSYMVQGEDFLELGEIFSRLLAHRKKYRNIRTSAYVFRKILAYFEKGYLPDCRTGYRFINVNPDGTFSPCGLIITDYLSLKDLTGGFSRSNSCVYCCTSIRANCEKPWMQLFRDYVIDH